MPNALTFIIGADANPYAQEFKRMESIAQSSARSISARLAQGAHSGLSGVIREAITIPREVLEGRGFGRIIGSSSILVQQLYNLNKATGESATAAAKAALELDAQALAQAKVASASLAKAAALETELTANTAATEADLEAAIAARAQAVADEEGAIALRSKAIAAANAAAVEEAESAAATEAAGGTTLFGVSLSSIAVTAAAILAPLAAVASSFLAINVGIEAVDGVLNRLGQRITEAQRNMRMYADAAREASVAQKNFDEFASELLDKREDPNDATKGTIKGMKEKFEKEHPHATEAQRRAEFEKEQKVRTDALEAANAEVSRDFREAKITDAQAHDPILVGNLKKAQKDLDNANRNLDKFENNPGQTWQQNANRRKGLEREQELAQKEFERAQEAQNGAEKAAKESRKRFSEAVQNRNEAQKSVTEAKSEFDADKGAQRSKVEHLPVNDLQRVGAFARDGSMVLESVQKSALHELKAIHSLVERGGGGLSRGQY